MCTDYFFNFHVNRKNSAYFNYAHKENKDKPQHDVDVHLLHKTLLLQSLLNNEHYTQICFLFTSLNVQDTDVSN